MGQIPGCHSTAAREYCGRLELQHRSGADQGSEHTDDKYHHAAQNRREPHHAERESLRGNDGACNAAHAQPQPRADQGTDSGLHEDHREQEAGRRTHGLEHRVLLQAFSGEYVEQHGSHAETDRHRPS